MANLHSELPLAKRVPDELLTGSDEARLAYFASTTLTVEHTHLKKAVEDLQWKMQGRIDQTYLMFLGPSGVGKTTAMRLLVDRMNRRGQSSFRTAISVEALASESQVFDWRGFYVDILTALGAPFPDYALDEVEHRIGDVILRTVATERYRANPTVPMLKRRVLRYISEQHLEMLAIDEAINFLGAARTRRHGSETQVDANTNANILKSLVNKSTCTILFAGAYDLFDHAFSSGQLARRGEIVHFRRYGETGEDITAFSHAFTGLLSHFPAEIEVDPARVAADVFEQSVGAVGNARAILHRGLLTCIRQKTPLTEEILKKSFFERARFQKLRRESEQGELKVKNYLDYPIEEPKPVPNVTSDKPTAVSQKRKVGEINPTRAWQGEAPSFE